MRLSPGAVEPPAAIPAFLGGATVDAYLDRHTAVAAATCTGVVLVHSALAHVHPRIRALVVAHEVGHVLQFRAAATVPDDRAETEAWLRAPEILCGLYSSPYRFRPRTCVAFAYGVFISSDASDYYREYPTEPIGVGASVTVDSNHTVIGRGDYTTLAELLQTLASAGRPGEDLVLTAHGAGDGLTHPAFSGIDTQAAIRLPHPQSNTTFLTELMTPDPADRVLQTILSLYVGVPGLAWRSNATAAEIDRLRQLRARVAAIGLGTVHFRGCSIGSNPNAMRTLRMFLGCRAMTASDITNVFGWIILHEGPSRARGPGTPAPHDHPGFPLQLVSGHLVHGQWGPHGAIEIWCETPADFDGWREYRFGRRGSTSRRSFHVMSDRTAGSMFIYPTEPAYASHLVPNP